MSQATSEAAQRWALLLSPKRRKPKDVKDAGTPVLTNEMRTEIERDYDRILFSTPVRRLADKTQVFPLDRNDSVRTRLTHSHEVSNLARSIGVALVHHHQHFSGVANAERNVPALLAAIGLAHDLGNPPFGHQGEAAIRRWFENHEAIFEEADLSKDLRQDFLNFEGNAQAFRLVTKLQILNDRYGLNLTVATLASLMKYSVPSNRLDKSITCQKKPGFFRSEEEIAESVLKDVGLAVGMRHPLAYVMEACDDIAYVVLDVEDAIKKGLASYMDLIAHIKAKCGDDPAAKEVVIRSMEEHQKFIEEKLSPAELNDISMQMFRVRAIGLMVTSVTKQFMASTSSVLAGTEPKSLIELSDVNVLRNELKAFASKHAYQHKTVLEVELKGYNTIQELMDLLWMAIHDREDPNVMSSKRRSPFARYTYSRISENYRRVFEDESNTMPIVYREAQLLTDMVSGMTDSFAMNFCSDLKALRGND
ncbi:MAG: dNTP triphosphohydrolase [Armatimonadota bacterium]